MRRSWCFAGSSAPTGVPALVNVTTLVGGVVLLLGGCAAYFVLVAGTGVLLLSLRMLLAVAAACQAGGAGLRTEPFNHLRLPQHRQWQLSRRRRPAHRRPGLPARLIPAFRHRLPLKQGPSRSSSRLSAASFRPDLPE